MRRIVLTGLISLFLLALTSCSVFSSGKAPHTFVINTIPCPILAKPGHSTLLVVSSDPGPIYNTAEIVYSTCPYQLTHFAKNEWVTTPAQMLHPLIVQTLQDTCHFRAVLSSPSVASYDYVLNTQLITLHQQFYKCSSVVRVGLRAQLINASTNKVIATRQFCEEQWTAQKNPYSGVIAANWATARILARLAQFCIHRI